MRYPQNSTFEYLNHTFASVESLHFRSMKHTFVLIVACLRYRLPMYYVYMLEA